VSLSRRRKTEQVGVRVADRCSALYSSSEENKRTETSDSTPDFCRLEAAG
jgi:hypothetical protein